MKPGCFAIAMFIALPAFGGSLDVIMSQRPGAVGYVPLAASIHNVVSLKIEDSPSTGSNIVSSQGIHFGSVNNLGSTSEPGVRGSQRGEVGHYEAEISFTVSRSGGGNMSLECRRSSPGNFNARDGVEIDDVHGSLRPLSALGLAKVTVLQNAPPGTYDKTLAINIYPPDKGELRTVLQFTLCVL